MENEQQLHVTLLLVLKGVCKQVKLSLPASLITQPNAVSLRHACTAGFTHCMWLAAAPVCRARSSGKTARLPAGWQPPAQSGDAAAHKTTGSSSSSSSSMRQTAQLLAREGIYGAEDMQNPLCNQLKLHASCLVMRANARG
jgi:hypothetical protein